MPKNQKHNEEVDRVLDICKAMGEAIPAKSTKQDVIDADGNPRIETCSIQV